MRMEQPDGLSAARLFLMFKSIKEQHHRGAKTAPNQCVWQAQLSVVIQRHAPIIPYLIPSVPDASAHTFYSCDPKAAKQGSRRERKRQLLNSANQQHRQPACN